MSDLERDPDPGPDRPVVDGLIALVGVAVIVGLILGGGALLATKMLGLGGDSAGSTSGAGESLYLPRPSPTDPATGPLVTLDTGDEAAGDESASASPKEKRKKKEKKEKKITLQTGQTEVEPMGRVDLSGIYPGGEGQILQVERLEDGVWEEFPTQASVSNEQFSTYVQTGLPGKHVFRVRDNQTGKTSNKVEITVN